MLLQVLLREQLINSPPPQGGGEPILGVCHLKLVEFVQKDGDVLAINPEHVASVEQRKPLETRIKMKDGSGHTVEVAFADVLSALQE